MRHRRYRGVSGEISFRPKRISINKQRAKKCIFNWVVLILLAAVIGYAFITFLFQTVKVVGPSMNNTLEDQQIVVVNKLSYKLKGVKRYDIIAYKKDNDEYYDIKRVIGLPGEKVKIENGKVFIDGKILSDDKYHETILNAGIAANEIELDDDEYFVLGDNINNSEDSRFINVGNINKKDILGKVVSIYKPKKSRGKVK